ncbi:MAG: DUF5752 family protein [archaeon]
METQLVEPIGLGNCPEENVFRLAGGSSLCNLNELHAALVSMDEYTFRYHVNSDNNKNDFASWVKDVLGDKVLARQLNNVLDQKKYAKIVAKRIKKLQA